MEASCQPTSSAWMSKVGVVQAEGAGEQACLSTEAAVPLNAQSCPQMTKDCRLTPHGRELSVSSAPGLRDSSPMGPPSSCGSLAIGGRRAISQLAVAHTLVFPNTAIRIRAPPWSSTPFYPTHGLLVISPLSLSLTLETLFHVYCVHWR